MIEIASEADIDRLTKGARLSAVVNTWAHLGLFETLAEDGPLRLSQLSGDERALRITGRMLANAGLLVRRDNRWALSASANKLVADGVLTSGRQSQRIRDLANLPEVVRQGGPVVGDDGGSRATDIGVHRDDPETTREFLEMLYRRSSASAQQTVEWIDAQIDESSSALDLGGGHGRYAREFVRRGHSATLFDFPICVEFARELHADKLEYREGDFFEDDLGGPYDVVVASNIVHGLSSDDNRRLLNRIVDVVAPGGLVVLKDMFLDEFGLWPDTAAHFGLLMLMYTESGDSYSLEDARQWFEDAGLVYERPVVFERFSLVVGKAG